MQLEALEFQDDVTAELENVDLINFSNDEELTSSEEDDEHMEVEVESQIDFVFSQEENCENWRRNSST